MKLGWHSRGYRPHFEAGERPQFLTWRLADSLPKAVLEDWTRELGMLPDSQAKKELLKRIGKYLDEGRGACLLGRPNLALIVQDGLLEGHGQSYQLHSWVVMPNHVHALLSPLPGFDLSKIMQKLKGASSRRINLERGATGELWHRDYMDKLADNEEMFERIRLYIEWNPVKAGLCFEPRQWPQSSANEVAWEKLKALEAEILSVQPLED